VCKVNWTLVIDLLAAGDGVLAAIGAFVAAVVALRIANRGREDSRRESDESHMAQARLVRVKTDGVSAGTRRVVAVGDQTTARLQLHMADFV
jgi:hypothetical protein